MQRSQVGLAGPEQLLVQLLPGAQPGVDDLHLAPRLPGDLAGHVVDAYRLAHVEDVRLTVTTDPGGQYHQVRGLLHGHEVAGDLRVGDRDRAARRRLRGERDELRATAAEDVAEADVEEDARVAGGGVRGQPLG